MMNEREKRETRDRLAKRFGWRCWYCGIKLSNGSGSIDHIIPKWTFRSSGRIGEDHEANLALTCNRCNMAKHDGDLDSFMGWIEWLRSGNSFTPFNMDAGAIRAAIEAGLGVSLETAPMNLEIHNPKSRRFGSNS